MAGLPYQRETFGETLDQGRDHEVPRQLSQVRRRSIVTDLEGALTYDLKEFTTFPDTSRISRCWRQLPTPCARDYESDFRV